MNVTTIELENNSRVFILDHFFENDLVLELYKLFDTVSFDASAWPESELFKHYSGRLVYAGKSSVLDKIRSYANTSIVQNKLRDLLGHNIKLSSLDLWVDQPGYTISPHYDPTFFEYAVQIYITNNPEYTVGVPFGTTIFQDQKNQVLLQLPYRTNFGYFFENPQKTYHGLVGTVPAGMQRNSVYLRFARV